MIHPLQSESNYGFTDTMNLIGKLLDAAWGNAWGTFQEASPATPNKADTTLPIITYKLSKLLPGQDDPRNREIKPRFREQIPLEVKEKDDPDFLNVYGQKMTYLILFDIWGTTNKEADNLSKYFRDFMFTYTKILQKKGCGQVLFKGLESKETNLDWTAIRELTYTMELEDIILVPSNALESIMVKLSVTSNLDDAIDSDNSLNIDIKSE